MRKFWEYPKHEPENQNPKSELSLKLKERRVTVSFARREFFHPRAKESWEPKKKESSHLNKYRKGSITRWIMNFRPTVATLQTVFCYCFYDSAMYLGPCSKVLIKSPHNFCQHSEWGAHNDAWSLALFSRHWGRAPCPVVMVLHTLRRELGWPWNTAS